MDLTTENTEDSQRNTEGFITQNSLVNLSALSALVVKKKTEENLEMRQFGNENIFLADDR
jgi:hypothetical protein